MKVEIKFKKGSPFKGKIDYYRNVTEIHYNFIDVKSFEEDTTTKQIDMRSKIGNRVAFESDIHRTGITQPIDYIEEFETKLEKEKAKSF